MFAHHNHNQDEGDQGNDLSKKHCSPDSLYQQCLYLREANETSSKMRWERSKNNNNSSGGGVGNNNNCASESTSSRCRKCGDRNCSCRTSSSTSPSRVNSSRFKSCDSKCGDSSNNNNNNCNSGSNNNVSNNNNNNNNNIRKPVLKFSVSAILGADDSHHRNDKNGTTVSPLFNASK